MNLPAIAIGACAFGVLLVAWRLYRLEKHVMADLSALTAQVKSTNDAEQAAIVLIQGLAAKIAASSGDQAAVDALAAQLKTSADALGAAVVANTPAAPAP